METIEQKAIRLLDKAQMHLANDVRSDTASLLGVLTKVVEQAIAEEREACAKMLDDDADRQESAWNKYIALGQNGSATSLHLIPRRYAEAIRARGDTPKGEVTNE